MIKILMRLSIEVEMLLEQWKRRSVFDENKLKSSWAMAIKPVVAVASEDGTETVYEADNIIIATGARARTSESSTRW